VALTKLQEIRIKVAHLGGTARARNMTPEQRSESARNAAIAKWKQLTPEQRTKIATKASRAAAIARTRRAKEKKERAAA
jgi:hypothetical protein